MQVHEIMTSDVVACHARDTMDRAVEVMLGKDCGCVPVVDDQERVVGIITDRDICVASYATGQKLSELFVRGGMAPKVECCAPDDSLDEAERKLRARQLRRLPVVDRDGRLVGILSMADLARAVALGKRSMHPADLCETLAAICRPSHEASATHI
jgi:CBS domain-containing protein